MVVVEEGQLIGEVETGWAEDPKGRINRVIVVTDPDKYLGGEPASPASMYRKEGVELMTREEHEAYLEQISL